MNSHVCQVFGVQVFAKLVREAIAAELSRGKERTNVRYTAYKLRVISRCRGGYRDINSRTNVKFLYHGRLETSSFVRQHTLEKGSK